MMPLPKPTRGTWPQNAIRHSHATYAIASGMPLDEVTDSRSGRGFWWWLFGTGDVGQANRDAEIRWKRMHDRIKETRDRRRA